MGLAVGWWERVRGAERKARRGKMGEKVAVPEMSQAFGSWTYWGGRGRADVFILPAIAKKSEVEEARSFAAGLCLGCGRIDGKVVDRGMDG
jgi:hypothetical protein